MDDLLPKGLKTPNFINHAFSALYEQNAKNKHFFLKNIWSVQRKAVILHSLLRNKCVSIFYRKSGH